MTEAARALYDTKALRKKEGSQRWWKNIDNWIHELREKEELLVEIRRNK